MGPTGDRERWVQRGRGGPHGGPEAVYVRVRMDTVDWSIKVAGLTPQVGAQLLKPSVILIFSSKY